MATLQAAPTRHHHTEQFSGILREGGLGKTQHKNGKQETNLLCQLFAKNCKQLHIQVTRCPCLRHWATPSVAGKTERCFEVNFAC